MELALQTSTKAIFLKFMLCGFLFGFPYSPLNSWDFLMLKVSHVHENQCSMAPWDLWLWVLDIFWQPVSTSWILCIYYYIYLLQGKISSYLLLGFINNGKSSKVPSRDFLVFFQVELEDPVTLQSVALFAQC